MANAVIPVELNLGLGVALVAANLLMIVVVPLWLLPLSPLWGVALVLPVLATPTLWSLIHEAIHGALHPDRRWNDRLGRVLAGLFGSPFQALRLGHLMHHRFNRSVLNLVEVARGAPSFWERTLYYARLFGGLYLGEVAVAALAILPDRFWRPIIVLAFGDEAPDGRSMLGAARKQLLEEPGRGQMRLDGLLITAGLCGSFALYGLNWWMLAMALLSRAFLVSFLDNAYHYATPLDDPMAGRDLTLPRPLQAAMLNFNLHATHHRTPATPWSGLPEAQRRLGGRFDGGLVNAALRQLAGPIPETALRRTSEARETTVVRASATGGAG